MTELDFPDASFDAIVSFYSIIHVPREEHPALFQRLLRMLKPGGLTLLSLGANDNPDDIEHDWLAGGAPMYWSHFDCATNLRLLRDVGFTILIDQVIMEEEAFGGGTHLFVLAVSG
jgi:SAM-dependent methyltransferase